MKKDIVKLDNEFNKLKFRGFGKMDQNLLMALCSMIRDKGTDEISISFAELRHLSGYTATSNQSFMNDIDRMTDKLMKVNSKIITEGRIQKFVLFPTCDICEKTETIRIAVNKDFAFLLNELSAYTMFELDEYIDLDSKYSKNLYRLLKQYRTTGEMRISDIDDFREKLDCPKKYSAKYFMFQCIKPAIEELNEKHYFNNLTVETEKARKRGAPTIGYIFQWEAEQRKINKSEAKKSFEQTKKQTKNSFNSFEQHQIDFDEFEKSILSN